MKLKIFNTQADFILSDFTPNTELKTPIFMQTTAHEPINNYRFLIGCLVEIGLHLMGQ